MQALDLHSDRLSFLSGKVIRPALVLEEVSIVSVAVKVLCSVVIWRLVFLEVGHLGYEEVSPLGGWKGRG